MHLYLISRIPQEPLVPLTTKSSFYSRILRRVTRNVNWYHTLKMCFKRKGCCHFKVFSKLVRQAVYTVNVELSKIKMGFSILSTHKPTIIRKIFTILQHFLLFLRPIFMMKQLCFLLDNPQIRHFQTMENYVGFQVCVSECVCLFGFLLYPND